ncbi:hypothetical protein PIB30_052782 [Stylosanthes scabra]|uniref:acireductone dioxygenase (Fe(2+)-requiring) n=1 Tax=Stylosanthes scabra TaxID=79078 RepID=A0ABU6TKA7_9FABA|nr:hypothetical protein [Stylosanthes scabra]
MLVKTRKLSVFTNNRVSTKGRIKISQTNTSMASSIKDPREEVLQAWYMDDSEEDQRLPHHKEPKQFVSLDQLAELGVLSWGLDADNHQTDPELEKIREERGYTYMDVCEVCPEKLPNYEAKIKSFFEEHLHTDEEIRFCAAGSGILKNCGDPHLFLVMHMQALRFFVGEPVWTPYNRPHDHLPAREEYIKAFVEKDVAKQTVDAAA